MEGEALRPYHSCKYGPVQWAQRKLQGQCLQTVTLSDSYWNSQQDNNRTLTNLISRMMTRKIIVSNNSFSMIDNKWKEGDECRLSVFSFFFFQANMNGFIVHILSEKESTERVVFVHMKPRSGKYSSGVALQNNSLISKSCERGMCCLICHKCQSVYKWCLMVPPLFASV